MVEPTAGAGIGHIYLAAVGKPAATRAAHGVRRATCHHRGRAAPDPRVFADVSAGRAPQAADMDPWIAFDEARARWERERDDRLHARARRWAAKQELLTNLVAFVITNAGLWAIWVASGAGAIWPMLICAPWSVVVAYDVVRLRTLSVDDPPNQPSATTVVSTGRPT